MSGLACGEGPPSTIPTPDKRFRTTAPSRIYFKNIRSTAYDWRQVPQSRTDHYTLRKIAATTPRPLLYPSIADVWMQDEAHLLLHSGRYEQLPTPLRIHWQSPDDSGVFRLDSLTPGQQYQLGLQLYEAISKGYQLEISFPEQEQTPLFQSAEARKLFLTTLQDYLRLTEYF